MRKPKRTNTTVANAKHSNVSTGATFGSCTDVGRQREQNEDSLLVRTPLYVVADGMGGHAAGEVASEIAVSVIGNQAPNHIDAEALGRAVEHANTEIVRAANSGHGRLGMGTTVTAAMVEGERLLLAQVGDSRAYLLHHGQLQQLTRDHSLMADLIEAGEITEAEARVHPQRNVITRALGAAAYVRPDLYELNVQTGDRLMLCSDGLYGMVADEDIRTTLAQVADPQACATTLVRMANKAGGADNITVIVVDIAGYASAKARSLTKNTKRTLAIIAGILVVALAGSAFGVFSYLHNSAYLADKDGYVAIYKGVPDGFMGLTYSELYSVSDIKTSDLSKVNGALPGHIREGAVKVDNVTAAESLLKEYQTKIDAKAAE